MCNSLSFSHNFCESRINNNDGPEYFNAVSSLFMTLIPLLIGIPNNYHFKKVSYMLIINGGCSFYYHYSLSWLGKQLDEITMLLANYYYMNGLLNYYNDENIINIANISNSIMLPVIISFNTIPQYDQYFVYIFSLYCFPTCIFIFDLAFKNNIFKSVIMNTTISIIGAIAWFISEHNCNYVTTYGHIIWHLCFPLGIYRILKIYDNIE
tara:strand:+ start:742 stop:1368 length:627 start_codon:yes stop_codon:yes gene_type:complete